MNCEKYFPNLYRYRFPLAGILFSIWGMYLRIRWLMARPFMDGDQFYQLKAMEQPFWEMIKNMPHQEHCSYLSFDYYVNYPFFRWFGFNKWLTNIPHLLITALGFYFFYLVCRQYLKTVWGLALAFTIFCFNISLIDNAVQIRVYAVLPTLALMCLYYSRYVIENFSQISSAKKFWLGAFFILLLWFHVYGVVILGCTMFFIVLEKYREENFRENFFGLFKFFGIVLLIAMPFWAYSVYGPHSPYRPEPPFHFIANPAINFLKFVKSILANLLGKSQMYFLLLGVLIPFVIPYKNRSRDIMIFFVLVVIPLQVLLYGVVKHEYWFLQRQFTWVMPFFAMYLASACESGILFFSKGAK